MSNVLGCTIFGGVAGSPLADVSAIGSVMIPLMKKDGYDADYAVNVTTHASLVGAIMPTSHNLIIFTLATSGIASVSVLSLMLAGLVPAIILTLCNLAAAYWVAVKRGYPVRPGGFGGWSAVLAAFLASLPGLLVVVIILGGILSGAFTATESASIAVAWALLITTLVYRSLTWSSFLKACAKACKTTGVVLLLIGVPGTAKSWVSEHLAAAISGNSTLVVQGTAGTPEEAIRYGWNYARLLAEGPTTAALVPGPVMRAMAGGALYQVHQSRRGARPALAV